MLKENHLDLIAKAQGFDSMQGALEKLYIEQRHSLEKCAEALDLSLHMIKKVLKLYKISTRHVHLEKFVIPAAELKKNTLAHVAKKYGVSPATIWRLRKKLSAKPSGTKP